MATTLSKTYKHLFFDLDHTLWDFEANSRETLIDLYKIVDLNAKGISDFEAFFSTYTHHNNELWSLFSQGRIKQDKLKWMRMHLTLTDFKIPDENERLARFMSDVFLQLLPFKKNLFPYTVEILEYLRKKGYELHLITNGFEEVQRSKIENSKLEHFFTELITSEASNSIKPKKAIFDYALNITGALPEESIMIGDNLDADIQGGINAGWDTIFVNHLQVKPHIESTYMIHHLKELEDIF